MTISRNTITVTWTGDSILDTGNSWALDSDDIVFSAACGKASIQVEATLNNAEADGDWVDCWLKYDHAGTIDALDTNTGATYVGRLNLHSAQGGEEPQRQTFHNIPVAAERCQLRCVGTGFASTDAVTLEAEVTEILG